MQSIRRIRSPERWQRITPSLALIMGFWRSGHGVVPTRSRRVILAGSWPGSIRHRITRDGSFFAIRHSPWAQWPLGLNRSYGSDAPGTIVLSDGIPLLAIALKYLSPLLPADFQYMGLWAATCLLLQAWFACKLLGRLTDDPVVRLIGMAFFLSATVFLLRFYMHPALSAQWLLVAGFYLAFDQRFRSRAWFALLCVAILVHAYLFVMLAALWAADIAQRLWRSECSPEKVFLHAVSMLVVVLMLMWTAGYFVVRPALGTPIRAHLDLLFPVWTGTRSFGEWSWFLPASDMDFLAYDGFGYLGLGFIALVLTVMVLGIGRIRATHAGDGAQITTVSTWAVLSFVCATLLVYALGNKVYFSQHLLFAYTQPIWLDRIYGVFRASARMMWPAWYLTLLAVFYLLLKRLPLRHLRYLVVIALVLQLADLSKAFVDIRAWASKNRAWHSAMISPAWGELARHYKHLVYLQPSAVPAGWVTFIPSYREVADYAAINHMTINIAYLAREDERKIALARDRRIALLKHGMAEPSTFYIIEDDSLWNQLTCAPGSTLWYGTVDKLKLVVPEPTPGLTPASRIPCGV